MLPTATIPEPFSYWADLLGPVTTTDGAAAALGITHDEVHDRLATGQVFGLHLAGGMDAHWVYPAWQFVPGRQERLAPILAAAGYDATRPDTQWPLAAWLASPNPRLDGRTPSDLVTVGTDPERFTELVELARHSATDLNATHPVPPSPVG